MEKAYLSDSAMAAMKDRRFYCFFSQPLKPSGYFMYQQVQHQTVRSAPVFCAQFNSIVWRCSVQRLTEIGARNLGNTDSNSCTPVSKVHLSLCRFS
jgi:hypothetical protein